MSKQSNQQDDEPLRLPGHEYVSTDDGWRRCLQQLQQQPRLALDLEANSMYAYREQICLVQISIPGQDYIVDPLADLDLRPLGELVQDQSVEKVFHAAEYDLILMKREFGWELRTLFDTMWAARILGYDRVGLANILADVFGVKLDKRFQRANWCRRPLPDAQLAYAQADTHYLLALREFFVEALDSAGRTAEAQEIFAEQSRIDVPDIDFSPDSFWEITGVERLSAEGQAVLKALNIYRDREARRRDQPHFKIWHDRTLLALARQLPADRQALQKIRGLSRDQIGRYGDDLLRIISENRGAPVPKRPRRKPRPPDDVLERYERLRTWRKERGQGRGVASDVILSRDALWELARNNPQTKADLAEIEGLGPWRLQTYGDEILRLLNGSGAGE